MNEPADVSLISRQAQSAIAKQNSRANVVVESIWTTVEELTNASERSDWEEVQRLARLIVLDALVFGADGYVDLAERVEYEIRKSPGSESCVSSLKELITRAEEDFESNES